MFSNTISTKSWLDFPQITKKCDLAEVIIQFCEKKLLPLEDTKKKLSDITMKYKERFLNGDVEEKEEISDDGLKEEEVIDINEI